MYRWRLRAAGASIAAAVALGAAAPGYAAGTMATGLETNANAAPLGIDDAAPTLSWRLDSTDRGVAQSKYQVVVATTAAKAAAGTGDVWDSGQVTSANASAQYAGPALAARTRYYWSVRSWIASGPTAYAPAAWFETAYLNVAQWQGTWISGPERLAVVPTAAQGTADDVCCAQGNTTLATAAAAGDATVRVASTTNFASGQALTVDSGAASETRTIGTVGSGAGSTTSAAPAAAGDTVLRVASITNFAPGAPLTIGGQTTSIMAVGTAAGAATTLFAPAAAGDTNIKVSSTAGYVVGQAALIENETKTVSAIGTQGRATTLSAAAASGDTNLKVASVTGITAGDTLTVGTGADLETRTITTVGTAGATGTGLTLSAALTTAKANAAAVRVLGSGITLAEPLTAAHALNAATRGLGSGIVVAPGLTAAAAAGAAITTPGTGLTLTGPLTNAHPAGVTAVGPVPADICRPAAGSPNAGTCKPVRPAVMLRKSFNVAPVSEHGAVTSARVYSSGLGWNEMTLNGSKTEPNGRLNPGFTEYNDTVQYLTDDITSLIKQGATAATENVIASELGAGRYDSESRPSNHHFEDAQWRAEETLRADLYVEYADGTEQLVKSDDSWKTSIDGPTRYADFDLGETFDARKQLPGWDTTAQNTASWATARTVLGPKGKLIAQKNELTKNVEDIKGPFTRWTISPGVYGFDIGKQTTGWATVKVWGAAAGQVVRVVNVERRNNDAAIPGTQDGALQLPGNLQQEYYVSDGSGTAAKPEVFTPKYNFSGFQWVQIAGSNGDALPATVNVDVDSVQVVHTALRPTGAFTSSSPMLNTIETAVIGSVIGDHMAGYMMDTPTYEKDGWTGDTQLSAPIASLLFDTQRQYQKSAIDVVDSQVKPGEYPGMEGQVGFLIPGAIGYGYCSQALPITAANQWACANGTLATASTTGPSVNVFKNANGGASPIWDAMLHVVPWEAYNRYDDPYALKTAYDAMKTYLDVTMEKWRKAPDYTPPSGSTEDEHTVTSFLGDWSFPTGSEGNAAEGTNVNATAVTSSANTAYYAYLAKITADSARVLGKPGEAANYDALYGRIKRDYNARFWSDALGYYTDGTAFMSQSVQTIALAMDLVPADKRRALQEKLVNDVLVTRTGHQETGIASARWLYPMLTQAAHEGVPNAAKAAFTAAQQTSYPSYGYWFQGLGFTGVGENWESGTRTRNHEMFGTIAQWFYEDVAGIKNTSPGYKTIQIRPLITPDGLASASASYDSIQGTIKSSWTQDAKGITMNVTVPPNTTAKVYVPGNDASKIGELGSGQALLAQNAPGVSLVGVEQDAVAFNVTSGSYTFVVGPGLFSATTATGPVGGTVSATLSLTLGAPAAFGPFTPGVAKDYTASTTATVISTAGDATLSVADPSGSNTGHLVNGTFALPQALQANAKGGAFAPVGGSSNPTTLLTYAGPVSNDVVPIGFKQSIAANDALRTGAYGKTLTFTLSTTTP